MSFKCRFGFHEWKDVAKKPWHIRNLWGGQYVGSEYSTQFFRVCTRCGHPKVIEVKGIW